MDKKVLIAALVVAVVAAVSAILILNTAGSTQGCKTSADCKEQCALECAGAYMVCDEGGCKCTCSPGPLPDLPAEMPGDFNVHYAFGVGEKNILDTENGIYTKDMVCEPPINYTMQLSAQEMGQIYDSVAANGLFGIKEDMTNNCNALGQCMGMEPLSSATLRITAGGRTKTIRWHADYFDAQDPDIKKFKAVTGVIQDIITQKEAERGVEQPTCGYL